MVQDRKEALHFLEDDIFCAVACGLLRESSKALFNGLDGFDSDCVTAHEFLDPYAKKGNSWALKNQYQMHMAMYNGDKIKAGKLLEKGVMYGLAGSVKMFFCFNAALMYPA